MRTGLAEHELGETPPEDFEEFKKRVIHEYVDAFLDRLLDLRNTIKRAKTVEELTAVLVGEKEFLTKMFEGIQKDKLDTLAQA